ncbi:MAG: hypothetical protein AAFP15_01150 [Bacteroidota bacterium]
MRLTRESRLVSERGVPAMDGSQPSLLRKLGAHSRTEAVIKVARLDRLST